MPFWRRWLGDGLVGYFELPIDSFDTNAVLQVIGTFPEAEVWRFDADNVPVDAVNLDHGKGPQESP